MTRQDYEIRQAVGKTILITSLLEAGVFLWLTHKAATANSCASFELNMFFIVAVALLGGAAVIFKVGQ